MKCEKEDCKNCRLQLVGEDVIALLEKFGSEWEIAEEIGAGTGEFEYKQFKESSLFGSMLWQFKRKFKGDCADE